MVELDATAAAVIAGTHRRAFARLWAF